MQQLGGLASRGAVRTPARRLTRPACMRHRPHARAVPHAAASCTDLCSQPCCTVWGALQVNSCDAASTSCPQPGGVALPAYRIAAHLNAVVLPPAPCCAASPCTLLHSVPMHPAVPRPNAPCCAVCACTCHPATGERQNQWGKRQVVPWHARSSTAMPCIDQGARLGLRLTKLNSSTVKALIPRRVCPSQCTGTMCYIST
jgi:hypothetical protein